MFASRTCTPLRVGLGMKQVCRWRRASARTLSIAVVFALVSVTSSSGPVVRPAPRYLATHRVIPGPQARPDDAKVFKRTDPRERRRNLAQQQFLGEADRIRVQTAFGAAAPHAWP